MFRQRAREAKERREKKLGVNVLFSDDVCKFIRHWFSLVHIYEDILPISVMMYKNIRNETKMKYETDEAEDENITEKKWLVFQREHKFKALFGCECGLDCVDLSNAPHIIIKFTSNCLLNSFIHSAYGHATWTNHWNLMLKSCNSSSDYK